LMAAGDSYTRDDIDEMDNGQMDSVWLTAGGWNCRGMWILDVSEWEEKAKAAGLRLAASVPRKSL